MPPAQSDPVLGVDACKGGWVGVTLREGSFAGAYSAPTIAELTVAATAGGGGEAGPGSPLRVIGIDMAVGLADTTVRQADLLARTRVGRLASSVFVIPVRAAVELADFADAVACQRRLTGAGISIQAHGLRVKLLEVDAWVRAGTASRVVEIHPEVAFAALNQAPLTLNKRAWGGMTQRRRLLADAGIEIPDDLGPVGRVGIDDVLDAAAVAWSAGRVANGQARCLPDPPERFSDGLDAAVWF
jgi:predicted RNase H-like nuclease